MIRTRVYRNGGCEDENFDPARVSDYLDEDGTVVWMDLCEPSEAEFGVLAEELGLSPLAVEDAMRGGQRPKLDRYHDHIFISLYDVELDHDSGELQTHELAVFANPRYLVTVRQDPTFPIDEVVSAWDASSDLSKSGAGFLLWGLLDVVVDGHFEVVQQLDDEIEDVEDRVFDPKPVPMEVQRRSFELRKSLVLLRRVVLPTREVVNSLMRREIGIVDGEIMPYYQDVYDHVLRATDWADSLRDLVSTILDTNLTIQSNRLSEISKKVTSWAAIVAIPTLVTGWFGQNVAFPGFGKPIDFYVSLSMCIFLSAALYVVFRMRDWL